MVGGGASASNPATGYTVSNVFPGSYKVQFNRSSGVTTTQEAQYYKDLPPESSGAGGATSVTVSAGQNAANIDATTRTGGTASGKVVGADGAPLENVPVRVYTKDGSLVTRAARTAVDGTFKVTGLSAGNYLVAATCSAGRWARSSPATHGGSQRHDCCCCTRPEYGPWDAELCHGLSRDTVVLGCSGGCAVLC